MSKPNTAVAGIDVAKHYLDVALHGGEASARFANSAEGHAGLVAWLHGQAVRRVGLEASGGYEREPMGALAEAGFEVVLHQPLEVRLFARIRRLRAKNDRIDARLIAAATAGVDGIRAAMDPAMAALAERLTAYEQASDLATQMKTTMEHLTLPDLIADARAQLALLIQRKIRLARDIIARIKADRELAQRFALVQSLPGFGPIVAMAVVIRMPELGGMNRGQAAALLGVAPFDRDSGARKGTRFITGGRQRPRRMLYLAALAAKRFDPTFRAFAERLAKAGKPPKVIIVAVMRKLIEAANIVLARKTPWMPNPA
jgi:transposase